MWREQSRRPPGQSHPAPRGRHATRFQAEGDPCCTERTFSSFIRAEEEIASLRVQMRRVNAITGRVGRGRRRRVVARDAGGHTVRELKEQLAIWQQKAYELPCRKCSFLAEHRAHHAR